MAIDSAELFGLKRFDFQEDRFSHMVREAVEKDKISIDFIKAERAVLELIVKHVGPVYVISPIVDEVGEIKDKSELLKLGLLTSSSFRGEKNVNPISLLFF